MVQQRLQGGSAGRIDVRATRNVILTVVSRLYMMVIETAGHGDVLIINYSLETPRALNII